MKVAICTAQGPIVLVDVYPDHDPEGQRKIDRFISEHRDHEILEHASHKSSIKISLIATPGDCHDIIDHDSSTLVISENYEVLECSPCGITVDATNGDFILGGKKIN